jgi:hypothetical protein
MRDERVRLLDLQGQLRIEKYARLGKDKKGSSRKN